MSLTVKQLINKLRKMPPDALVIWQDHDNSEDEYNDYVRRAVDVTDEFSASADPEVRVVALRG